MSLLMLALKNHQLAEDICISCCVELGFGNKAFWENPKGMRCTWKASQFTQVLWWQSLPPEVKLIFYLSRVDKHSLILLVIACLKLCKKEAALITNQSINNKGFSAKAESLF